MSAAAGASGVMCSAAVCVCGVCIWYVYVVCVCVVCVCGVCVWCMYVQEGGNLKSCVITTVNILHCCKAHKCEAWSQRSTYIWLADWWEDDDIW